MSQRSDVAAAPADSPARLDAQGAQPGGPSTVAFANFLTSLAHALRSPLGVVSGALAELGAERGAAPTDQESVLLALTDRGLRRIGHIADTVSLAATLESGTLALQCAPADLVALVRDAAAKATALERRREVQLAFDPPPGPWTVCVDAARVTRAVSELLINAIRHAVRHVRVSLEQRVGEARIVIEDDGFGVPEARRKTLFTPYLHESSPAGLGMGLWTSRDVIAEHRGSIVLEASTLPPGRAGTVGARFVIAFPRPPVEAGPLAPQGEPG